MGLLLIKNKLMKRNAGTRWSSVCATYKSLFATCQLSSLCVSSPRINAILLGTNMILRLGDKALYVVVENAATRNLVY